MRETLGCGRPAPADLGLRAPLGLPLGRAGLEDGSIDWCVFHRFEARPVYARLLDWEQGGYFQVAPTGEYESSREYVPNTNVLEMRFETAEGVVKVVDGLVVRVEEGHPDHRLVRRQRRRRSVPHLLVLARGVPRARR